MMNGDLPSRDITASDGNITGYERIMGYEWNIMEYW